MAQRTRALTERMAGQVSAYLQELMDSERAKGHEVSCGVFDNSGAYPRQVSTDDVSVKAIQDISVNDNLYAAVRSNGEMRVYSGKMPFEVTSEVGGKETQMYLDELMDYLDKDHAKELSQQKSEQVQQTSAVEKQSAASAVQPESQEDKFAAIRAKAEQYHIGDFNGRLVGVGRRLVRTRDNVQDAFVSVAIPWEDAKNGLGYIDIPKDVFDAANTPADMKTRNSYHIPLEKEAYGMWYVDKNTELAIKPTIPADIIYQAYEVNRVEYRKSQEVGKARQAESMTKPAEQMEQQPVQTEQPVSQEVTQPVSEDKPVETQPTAKNEAAPVQASEEPKQREVPNIVNEIPDFGEELEFA